MLHLWKIQYDQINSTVQENQTYYVIYRIDAKKVKLKGSFHA